KFASLVVAPLWLTYPGRRPSGRFAAGFAVATLAAFSVVLLEPNVLHVQRVLQVLLLAGALAAAVVPVRKSPLQLAALTAALLAGFQCVLTYWLYTYIPWFFAFAAIALLAPRLERHAEELDPERAALVGAVDDDALEPHPALSGLEANG